MLASQIPRLDLASSDRSFEQTDAARSASGEAGGRCARCRLVDEGAEGRLVGEGSLDDAAEEGGVGRHS
jgi:hypothetical protein